MSTRRVPLLGAVVGAIYAVVLSVRGDVAPGIVGGVLAGILFFLVMRQVADRQWQRIREWERRQAGRDG